LGNGKRSRQELRCNSGCAPSDKITTIGSSIRQLRPPLYKYIAWYRGLKSGVENASIMALRPDPLAEDIDIGAPIEASRDVERRRRAPRIQERGRTRSQQ
jgi:hypothetical protein